MMNKIDLHAMNKIGLQTLGDLVAVEDLLDLAFGADRFGKAAYQFRFGVLAVSELSFIIKRSDKIIATLRFWPIKIGLSDVDALLLGPIAVNPQLQGKGYGIRLMEHGLDVARSLGHSRVLLVGDEEYYSKVGFSRKAVDRITMPGEDDQSRLLGHALKTNAFDGLKGAIQKY